MSNKDKNIFIQKPIYIIAEVANAAQGKAESHFRFIEEAKRAGADAIKFQLYKYDVLTTPAYSKYEIYKRTFYNEKDRSQFIDRANESGLDVWVDIFDRWGLEWARKKRDKLVAVKIPPTVILDGGLVKNILELSLPVAVGVGGYEDKDIDFVLSQLSGFDNPILLMYGFQGFPTAEEDTSLSRIPYIKGKYKHAVGFADHIDAGSPMALRMPEYAFFAGASVIEKHITLDRSSKGLDYYSSLEPDEFKVMVDNLKSCVGIYGSSRITSVQKDYLAHATRITTTKRIKAGELFFCTDTSFRRTDNSNALLPNKQDEYFPAVALREIEADVGVSKDDVRKATAGTVVVCRLSSTRLHRKALLELNGIPAIERCLLNTLASKHSATTILATSAEAEDQELKKHTLNGKAKFFQGSADDPAERILAAAEHYGLDIIVRVTGDSPLISYELIDLLLESHFKTGADFSFFADAPLGTKPEVINTQSIKRLKSLVNTDGYSEYLTLYFKNNPEFFQLNEVAAPEQYRFTQYRLNLDYPEDYEVNKAIFEGLDVGSTALPLESVIKFLQENPKIASINADIKPKYKSGEFAEQLNKVTRIKRNGSAG